MPKDNKECKQVVESKNEAKENSFEKCEKCQPCNKVTIKTWQAYKTPHGRIYPGHVAIKTPTSYISFHPKSSPTERGVIATYFSSREAMLKSPEQEAPGATKEVTLYCLNTKEMETTFQKYHKDFKPKIEWTLLGPQKKSRSFYRLFFGSKVQEKAFNTDAHSCASMALEILKAGEIESVLEDKRNAGFYVKSTLYAAGLLFRAGHGTERDSRDKDAEKTWEKLFKPDKDVDLVTDKTLITPGDIEEIAETAKKHELEKFPDTAQYDGSQTQEYQAKTSCTIS